MFFEDGFKYDEKQTIELTKWAILKFIKSEYRGSKPKQITISGVKLIEAVLRSFGISSFDFFNNDTYFKVEKGIVEGLKFLVENQLIASAINGKDKFYRYFIRRDLYRIREFSNEFEVDTVANLIYKIGFSLKYNVFEEFIPFYNAYTTDYLIKNSHKRILISLPDMDDIIVIAMRKHVDENIFSKTVEKYDYTDLGDFVACYYQKSDNIVLLPTKKSDSDETKALLTRLLLIVNVEGDLKQEFKY